MDSILALLLSDDWVRSLPGLGLAAICIALSGSQLAKLNRRAVRPLEADWSDMLDRLQAARKMSRELSDR